MSFVSAVKDYVEFINHLYITHSEGNLFWFIQQTLLYWLNSIKLFLSYIISFQWIRDIIYLPINLPKLKFDILHEHFVLNGDINTLNFWQNTGYNDNHILLGFLNSFFLYLPISAPILIAIRTLVVKGIPAGIFAGWGILTGQMLFLICVLLGLRDIVIPWFALEPWTYLLGLILIVNAVYDMATSPSSLLPIHSSNRIELFKIFAFHFVLNWTEQTCLFQYFGNFSFSTNPTILEHVVALSQTTGEFEVVLSHFSYLFGILVGSIFWLVFFGWLSLRFIVALPQWFKTTYSFVLDKFNLTILSLTFAFAVSSIPYYGIDYLITKPLGFVSEDKALQAVQLRSELPDHNFPASLLGGNTITKDGKTTLATDISIFGRGEYLADEFSLTKEALNYRGEFFWATRFDRINLVLKQKNFQSKVDVPNLNLQYAMPLNFVKVIPDYEPYFWYNPRMQSEVNPKLEYLSDITLSSFNRQFHSAFPQRNQEDGIQSKTYNNFLYKRLFNWDMDLFINRKPKAQILTTNQEKNLFFKRQILSNYYNTLRDYKKIRYYDMFKDVCFGTKSYADRVYNQQFQGTLKIIRRLFAITLSDVENPRQDKVLKYDQPLYNEFNYKKTPILHEELALLRLDSSRNHSQGSLTTMFSTKPQPHIEDPQSTKQKIKMDSITGYGNGSFGLKEETKEGTLAKTQLDSNHKSQFKSDTIYDADIVSRDSTNTGGPIQQESIYDNKKESSYYSPSLDSTESIPVKYKPFIKLENPVPLYAGWDNDLRRFVITNRLLPRKYTAQIQELSKTEMEKYFNPNIGGSLNNNKSSSLGWVVDPDKGPDSTEEPLNSVPANLNTSSDKSSSNLKKIKRVYFSAWPINPSVDPLDHGKEQNFDLQNDKKSRGPSVFAFVSLNDVKYELLKGILLTYEKDSSIVEEEQVESKEFDTVPPNALKLLNDIEPTALVDVIPPNRGGWLWAGTENLKFDFKQNLSTFLSKNSVR